MSPADEQRCFYVEVGFSITQWAHVEDSLRHAMLACFPPNQHNALSLGFFSIENFRSKLEFVDKVVGRVLTGSEHSAPWKKLVDRARSASVNRNKLAHMKVTIYPDAGPGRRYALEPWIVKKEDIQRTRGLKPLPGALCLRDIVRTRHEFFALTISLVNFSSRLRGEPEPHPKSSEQASIPPTLESIRREVLGEPPGSPRSRPEGK